ncbi:basic leucine zipper 19 [Nicotiana sylvestris]|uniref:Basic leucine zipper 19 n=1 Tax=Nicotiana sylvestris TaxID=4096 RepID=A0A1U7V9F0_NICSY|nr:PREDICTED: basic leucine zipper 19 [Nicotiana sylvestris]XP_009764672.1 PREDICTED: basic leucine zipper 19 [Nicotiana sylvestris]
MSRQAHLPPRCPFQKKPLTSPVQDPFNPTSHQHNPLPPRHHKSISQSYILEEQPAWLDELLNESNSNSDGIMHRRSASDSFMLLDGLVSLEGFDKLDETESNASCESDSSLKTNCVYGPNSPRGKSNVTFAENAIVSALSEYVSPNPLQYLDRCISVSGAAQSELAVAGNVSGAADDVNAEAKAMKRHPGQRSRVRKLQYIAELERTVNTYEALESELAAKVASLLQQRVALSMENRELKQQMLRLQQEKVIVDAQYRSLRKELERLRYLAHSPNFKKLSSAAAWQMLDFGKLDLN